MTLCGSQRLIIKINTFVSKKQVVNDCIVEILQPICHQKYSGTWRHLS